MKIKKYEKGLSLIEIIIAICLLGMISVSFIPLFSIGFNLIYVSGKASQNQYANEQAIESKLSGSTSSYANVTIAEPTSTVSITFGITVIQVTGKTITSSYSDGKTKTTTLTRFVPN